MFKKISFSLPLQLITIIIFVLLFGNFLPKSIIRGCYTFSLFFKEALNFSFPFIIFVFILTGILSFKKNAPMILVLLIIMIFFSNTLVVVVSYVVAWGIIPTMLDDVKIQISQAEKTIIPFFTPSFTLQFNPGYVLLFCLGLGIILNFVRFPSAEKKLNAFKTYVLYAINIIIIPLFPLYVLGLFLKNNYEGSFRIFLFQNYGTTFLLIIMVQVFYILFFYAFAADFSIKKTWSYIKNALPSYLGAFTTMSSMATMSIAVASAKKNTRNKPLAQMAVPIMTNMHLVGDAIIASLLSLAILVLFTGDMPDFISYMTFAFYFFIAMLAVSGIPGGSILAALPILRAQFGFTTEMEGVFTALYFLLDSFGTGTNTMGNDALIIILNKILHHLKLRKG